MSKEAVVNSILNAIDDSNCTTVTELLGKHPELADVIIERENGGTFLHHAACYDSFDMMRLLLDHGVPIDVVDDDHETALCIAALAYRKSTLIVELLLERGANPNGNPGQTNSPLHYCAGSKQGNPVVGILVKHGANIEIRDELNETPLMRAAHGGNIAVLKNLLESGADVFAVGGKQSNQTALDMAREKKKMEVVNFLEAYTKSILASKAIEDANKLSAGGSICHLG